MTDISDDDEFLDPMPIEFICSITQERMIDPVMAMDGKSYERTGIQQWFDGGNRRSPLSGFIIDTLLVPNHDLKARIHQWVDDQRQGRAAKQKLTLLHAELMSALMTTNKDQAFNIVQEVSELITTSTLLIAPNSIDRLKKLLEFSNMMNAPLQTMLTLLFELCKSKINAKQERHRELRLKCQTLEQVQQNLADKRDGWSVMTTQYRRELDPSAGKSTAYTLFQGGAIERIQKENPSLSLVEASVATSIQWRALNETERQPYYDEEAACNVAYTNKNEALKRARLALDVSHQRLINTRKLCLEYTNERDQIEQQLESVGVQSQSNDEYKRVTRSSSRSSTRSSTSATRGAKRRKKEPKKHAGQWLFEEGHACKFDTSRAKKNAMRGRLMIEASATSGFSMALAYCHYYGWNSLEKNTSLAFDTLLTADEELNGYHHAQCLLGTYYRFVGNDEQQAVEMYTKSADQGNVQAKINMDVYRTFGWTVVYTTASVDRKDFFPNKRNALPSGVEDIDALDKFGPRAKHWRDVFTHFRATEGDQGPSGVNYMLSQDLGGGNNINANMRAILFDWIVDVHLKYQYKTETLYLTFNLIDRYLEAVQVSRGSLQLVGVICLWIATKYGEEQRPIRDSVFICDSAYTKEQMLEMERTILVQLEYRLTVPTQYDFLTRYINVGKLSVETKLIAYYFLEKSMIDIDMLVFKPSFLAAASILLAKKAESLKAGLEYNLWPSTMEFYTRHTQEELTECGEKMIHIVQQHNTDTLQSIYKKYAAARMGNAAGDAYIVKTLVPGHCSTVQTF